MLSYSTYLGGNGSDSARTIAVDAQGNAYVVGLILSANFPTTSGSAQPTYGGGSHEGDAFVTKLDATGTAPVFSTYLGGGGEDSGFGVAVDGDSYIYVAGNTESTDFPTTGGAFQTVNGGKGGGPVNCGDAFVAKLDASGSTLIYSTFLGGTNNDCAFRMTVDADGHAYVIGVTSSSNFPTTATAFQKTSGGGTDVFVTKMDATSSGLVYSTYLGGRGDDIGRGIVVDAFGNAYTMGSTESPDFPTTPGAFQLSFAGGGLKGDAFVTKLDAAGSSLSALNLPWGEWGRGWQRYRGGRDWQRLCDGRNRINGFPHYASCVPEQLGRWVLRRPMLL